jgi:PPP family 3-phenylpropionic acid transporter
LQRPRRIDGPLQPQVNILTPYSSPAVPVFSCRMAGGLVLRLFWFFYFCGLGIFAPYFSMYLRENAALAGTQVGLVLAVFPLVGVFAQPFWGYVADRTGARGRLLILLGTGAALGHAALGWVDGFAALLLATAALAVFATPIIPGVVSVSFAALRYAGPHAFGFVRVWGTVGFLLFVVSFPSLLDHLQASRGLVAQPGGASEPGLAVMFGFTALLTLAAAATAVFLPSGGVIGLRARAGEWRVLVRHPAVVRLLLFDFTAFLSLQGPMGLFPIYIRARGGDMQTVGHMWVFMLVLEIPLILLSGATLARLGARGLLTIGTLAGGIRWMVCGLSGDLSVIYPVQVLHGVVVAGLLLGSPLYLESVVPEHLRSTGQGLLAMAGAGLGAILSNAIAGLLLEHAGPAIPYFCGGAGAILLGLGCHRLLPPPARIEGFGNHR